EVVLLAGARRDQPLPLQPKDARRQHLFAQAPLPGLGHSGTLASALEKITRPSAGGAALARASATALRSSARRGKRYHSLPFSSVWTSPSSSTSSFSRRARDSPV